MKFNDAYEYSDAIFSERFEQIYKMNFTDEEIYYVNTTQKFGLIRPYTDKARKLFISKLFETALVDIQKLSNKVAYAPPVEGVIPKYVIYSAHDL